MTAPHLIYCPKNFPLSLFSPQTSSLPILPTAASYPYASFFISSDIHLNPGPIDPCSVCSHRVTWGNRLVQCTNCSLWVHLSCSRLSPADFCGISLGHSWTCPMCPSSSRTSPFHSQHIIVFPFTNTHKPSSSKMNSPKTTL